MNFSELYTRTGLVAAHRGASSIAPENTLRALQKSLGHCDFIEIDVQLSRDGEVVVFHDETLQRTTNLNEALKVSQLSFDELSKLDYGSWFDSKSEPLLTLHKALKFVKENNLFLNIEIKDISESFSDKEVVNAVVKEIRESKTENRVLISSFRAEYLPLCKKMIPELICALIVEEKHPENLLQYLKSINADGYHMSDEIADKETLKILKEGGFFVGVYTINDKKRAEELFEMGVNAVFSDKAGLF